MHPDTPGLSVQAWLSLPRLHTHRMGCDAGPFPPRRVGGAPQIRARPPTSRVSGVSVWLLPPFRSHFPAENYWIYLQGPFQPWNYMTLRWTPSSETCTKIRWSLSRNSCPIIFINEEPSLMDFSHYRRASIYWACLIARYLAYLHSYHFFQSHWIIPITFWWLYFHFMDGEQTVSITGMKWQKHICRTLQFFLLFAILILYKKCIQNSLNLIYIHVLLYNIKF